MVCLVTNFTADERLDFFLLGKLSCVPSVLFKISAILSNIFFVSSKNWRLVTVYGGGFVRSVMISVATCFKNCLLILLEMEFDVGK